LWEAFFADIPVKPSRGKTAPTPVVEVENTSDYAKNVHTTFEAMGAIPVDGDDPFHSTFLIDSHEEVVQAWAEMPPIARPKPPPTVTSSADVEVDFNRTISLLREHPTVLRALGLIFDVRLSNSSVPRSTDESRVQVRWPDVLPGLPKIVNAWTRYEFDGENRFFPLSTTNISSGMVTLTDDRGAVDQRWRISTVDIESAATRLHNAAQEIEGRSRNNAGQPDKPVTPPALQSAGLVLLRSGLQADFDTRRQVAERNAARTAGEELILDADDLVLGYRIDVQRQGGDWFSLHERVAKYEVDDKVGGRLRIGGGPVEEEGHLKAYAAVDDGVGGPLRADEVVARWTGWSLSVPRPALDARNEKGGRARPDRLPYSFTLSFKAKDESLPRLRFGHKYNVRARVADMAGGGLQHEDADARRCALEENVYSRHEPISSPILAMPDGVQDNDLGPGEAIDHVVIRSVNGSVAEFDRQNPQYTSRPERGLLRPLAPLELVEQHGALDADTPEELERAERLVVQAILGGTGGQLPDPTAQGICAFPLPAPDLDAEKTSRDWVPQWPDSAQKLLRLTADPTDGNPVEWEGNSLMVHLAPGEQVTVELSSSMKPRFFADFALGVLEGLPDVSANSAKDGRHPMVTPARTITLVHAVRAPLGTPGGQLVPRRKQGETFAVLEPSPAMLHIDPKSTAQIELTGTWTEFDDNLQVRVTSASVQQVVVDRGEIAFKDELRHEFGDTKHRRIEYTVTALSRFRQYFNKAGEDEEAFVARTTLPSAVLVPNSALPAAPVVLSVRPAFQWSEEPVGPNSVRKRRFGGGVRVELQRPWYQTGEGERLAVVVWRHPVDLPPDPFDALTQDSVPPEEDAFITQVGRDPIWATSNVTKWPSADDFALNSEQAQRLPLRNSTSASSPVPDVVLVPYEPWFDAESERWFADIAIPGVAAVSYCPFVQLALVRFQPNSLPGLEYSEVVRTEHVQLFPERAITYQLTREFDELGGMFGVVQISLEGIGHFGRGSAAAPTHRNKVEVVLEHRTAPEAGGQILSGLTALEPPDPSISAWVTLETAREDFRSSTVGSSSQITSFQIRVAREVMSSARVRVREIELFGPTGEPFEPQTGTEGELAERVVFTDVHHLDFFTEL
jgi:hypothetical protein